MEKKELLAKIDRYMPELTKMADDIFDHPEIGYEEHFASKTLCDYLEAQGFTVEKGVGGLETAFRATWEYGTGGPSIGFLGEYDALKGLGHGCGHHLQTPAAIGTALLFKEYYREQPFKLVIYGTPAEETTGGKIIMAANGCFRDIDLCFSNHTKAAGNGTGASGTSMALGSSVVTFKGTPAHAGASPEKGRSALDAMLLAFHGIECLREHIKTGCRVHYTVLEGTGAANIVHEKASARITCRAFNKTYLEDMIRRMKLVVEGAAMMTETEAEVECDLPFYNTIWSCSLDKAVRDNALLCGAPKVEAPHSEFELSHSGGGATDFGNVTWLTPGVLVGVAYTDAPGHSRELVACGKQQTARDYVKYCAQIMAGVTLDFLQNEEFRNEVRAEHAKHLEDLSKLD